MYVKKEGRQIVLELKQFRKCVTGEGGGGRRGCGSTQVVSGKRRADTGSSILPFKGPPTQSKTGSDRSFLRHREDLRG